MSITFDDFDLKIDDFGDEIITVPTIVATLGVSYTAVLDIVKRARAHKGWFGSEDGQNNHGYLITRQVFDKIRDELANLTPLVDSWNSKSFDEIRRTDSNGNEFWYARELKEVLGYYQWRRFNDVIERSKISFNAVSIGSIHNHFANVGKNSETLQTGGRPGLDYKLSRYACYLVAMNGDVRKPEIAAAQSYFAVQTIRMEQEDKCETTSVHPGVRVCLAEHEDRLDYLEDKILAVEKCVREYLDEEGYSRLLAFTIKYKIKLDKSHKVVAKDVVKFCEEKDYKIKEVADLNYVSVNSYPEQALKEFFGIE